MKYKVHRLEVTQDNMQEKLENFINHLNGEVISITPNIKPVFMMYGSKVDFLLIVEKIK